MKFAALAKLEIELDQAEGGGDRAKAYLAVLDMLSKMGKHSEVLRRGEEFLTIKAMVSKSPAKLLMAGALENLGKVDDAIAQYEQLA
ncbi:hypothetical protein N9195_01075 [bacterium]|nr:hypothetical protein [bacterium]